MITFITLYLPINQGHGNACRVSLDVCTNDYVALMDADDVCLPNRFKKQVEFVVANPNIDIVGGQITEFVGCPSNIIAKREVPCDDSDIKSYIKKRCPMNQVTVMFKKLVYEKVGGYVDWFCNEDYFLWNRMLLAGCTFANVPENLVNVRVGEDMSARRGGWKYFTSEAKLQWFMLKNGIISLPRYLYNVAIRFGGEVVLTNSFRIKLFKCMRKSVSKENLVTQNLFEGVGKSKVGTNYPPFSVAMCVYGKDNPEWFDKALESVIVNQTVRPSEVVLVVDGPIPDTIQVVIDKYKAICKSLDGDSVVYVEGIVFIVRYLSINKGLGNALKLAIEMTNYELVARMDSDDIATPNRFEMQLENFQQDSQLSIVGGNITEFIGSPQNIVGYRIVPITDTKIRKYMKSRCGFNHMTVMYKRSEVLRVGNYQDWFWNEDYYLWIRMMLGGCKFANLSIPLVNVRVGRDMYKRRGGKKYFKSEAKLQKYMYRHGIISYPHMLVNICIRFIIQCAMPNNVRGVIFQKLFRKL